MIDADDAQYLLGRPEFLRFMYGAIQSAGLFGHQGPAHEPHTRDFHEGRRSLGLELLMAAHTGQPEPLRDAEALTTLNLILSEIINPKGRPRGRRAEQRTDDRYDDDSRYRDLDERDGSDDG